jgi:hypothetical protein
MKQKQQYEGRSKILTYSERGIEEIAFDRARRRRRRRRRKRLGNMQNRQSVKRLVGSANLTWPHVGLF